MSKYSKDYKIEYEVDELGKEKKITVYQGDFFKANLNSSELIDFKRNCLFLFLAITVLQVCGGFVANNGMYQFNISLPYVFAFLPLYYLAAGILHLPKEKRKYRRDEIGLSFDRIRTSSKVLMIFLIIVVLGELLFILFASAENRSYLEILFLTIEIFSLSATIILIRMQNRIQINLQNEDE